jgi:hypothetical protein
MKRLLILTAITAGMAPLLHAQNTTYGGGNAPLSVDAGYVSDYSPGGTIVLADGFVTLANNATYEHGNNLLQNSGSWTSTGSLDLFLSAGSNTISGTIAPSFFNVQFNIGAGNTMAITNAQGVDIAGTLQFNNGVTTTVRSTANTGALHFAAGAAYTSDTTDVQHVNGYVSKTGNTAFTFPVGSGTDVRILSISAPVSALTEISTAWFAGNPGTVTDPSDGAVHSVASFAAPIQSVSTAGFWDWIPVAGSDDGLTVTVSIPDMSASSILPADLRLVGWNGTQWIDLSGSGNASGNTENSTLSGTIPAGITISALGIGSTSTPLPVHFSAFDAYADNCNVQLNWSTAMEINNDYFTVERSLDGRAFTGIATVQSMGNSAEKQDYSYTDEHPKSGLNYYRVRQVDQDGKYTATSIRQAYVHCNGDDAIKVFPTVSNNSVQVVLPSGYEGATVELLTTLGQVVKVPIEGSNLSYRIHLNQLASAMYMVRIRKGTELHSYKIIKGE